MAADFNPYHVWLSIPPEEQPPNLYRLLGLRLFETSGEVIDGAADRQMAHLRTLQGGKHGDLTQRLLNEVAAARVSLLDPKKRVEYDQQLRAKLAAAAPAPAAQPAGQPAKPPVPLRRAPAQADADKWDDLLGDSGARTPQNSGIKSAKSLQAAAKRDARNRQISVYIAAAVVLIVAVGIGFFVLNRKTDGTLVLDWPASELMDTAISVDGAPIEIPATGQWEHNYPAGPHHFAAQRPAFKMTADITLAAGERMSVSSDWKPKAVLALSWPAALRSGAVLKIDGHVQSISQHDPLEMPVEPGRHTIQVTRPGSDPIGMSALVAFDGRELVAIAAPRAGAKLVFDWPAGERKDAELIVDGSSRAIADGSDSEPFALTLEPGRHVVQITRRGFEPFNQAIELSAGANSAIKPTWAPEQKSTAPTVADTQVAVEVAPQPAKKLPVPTAAEQEKIAKQLNNLYKTSQPGPKDPVKAQKFYEVAARAGSSPAERYMLLMKGAEIAAAAGDLNLSLQGIDTLDADYDIDALEAKQKLLEKFIAAGKPEQVAVAIPAAEQLVDQAVAADRFDIAVGLATSASKAVVKSKIATHKEDEERLSRRRHDIHLLEPIYMAAKKAQETLGKNPADPEANLTVARWRCFYKGDWTTGLPLLAKGSNEKLKSLAEQESKAPANADQQVQLADAWWDLAQKESGTARDSLRLHAGAVYQASLPKLTSVLKKAAIEKRLAEITNLKPVTLSPAPASNASILRYSTTETTWQLGSPGVELIPKNTGFCFLSSLAGHLAGYGEGVTVRVGDDGFWSLEGHSAQDVLSARAISIEHLMPAMFKSETKEFHWRKGDSPVRMLNKADGICFLSSVEGHFEGAGEEVAVRLRNDGYWYLEGRSRQDDLGASAIGIEWTNPGAYSIEAEEHSWSVGDSPVRLLKENEGFAFLSSVSGHFLGAGEEVRVYLADDGQWRLEGRSGQKEFAASATAVRVAKAPIHGKLPATATSVSPTGSVEFPLNRWVDILRLIDPTADEVYGKWSRDGAEISCQQNWYARIEAPVAIDGEYDLETEFTRADGLNDVNTIIPVAWQQCDVVMSGWSGKASGLAEVDRRLPLDENNPTSTRPGTIENGRRYKVLISVRLPQPDRASIDVSLDGKPYLPHWEGKVSSLSLNSDWWMPHSRRPGLATFEGRVTYHAMRLRMISGHAAADIGGADLPAKPGLPTIVSARWGCDDTWADVTANVRQTIAREEIVYVNYDFLKSDPAPGKKKRLQISYKLGEKEQATDINEGGKWSKDDYNNSKP
jgi:hypothetical protein